MTSLGPGVCVKLPDKRIGRIRDKVNKLWRVRVKRTTSETHQFLYFKSKDLKIVPTPKGWMSVSGYNNYVKKTIAKMKKRNKQKH